MADSNSINTPLARNQNITPLEIDFREPPSSISYNLEAFHDPHDFHNKDAAKSTSLQASFTLFCSFVGVSLLSIPYSFKLAGLGLSIISMIIIAYLTWYCLSLVLIVAEAQPGSERMTLEILSHKLLGNWAVYVVQISVSLLQIGICTVILMFSSSFLDYVVCNFGIVSLCGNIPFRTVVVLIVTIPLTMINNMHWFYISSLFSSIFIFIGVITQFSFNINVLEQQPLSTDYILSKLNEFKFYNLPVFFGVAIYTFEGIGTLFSVRYAMQTPRDFPGILRNQMIMIAFLYILFPAMCYIAFGSNVPEVVTFTLPINNSLYLWVQGLLVVAALCGYSLQLFPTLKILENSSMFRHRIFDDKGRTKNPFLRYGLRIMIIFLMIIVVFSGVSFNLWISFIGAFVSTFIGFILPVLLYERQFGSNVPKKTKILNKISLYAGGIMGVLGVTQTLGIMVGVFPKAE